MSPIHVKFTYYLDLIFTYLNRVPWSSSTGLLNHYNLDRQGYSVSVVLLMMTMELCQGK
jgi:hypothetical protein